MSNIYYKMALKDVWFWLLCLVGSIVLLVYLFWKVPSSNDHNLSKVSGDLALSSRIKGSMDTSINPCTDFYTFACGNHQRNNLPVPSFAASWDQPLVDTRSLEVDAWAKVLLEKPVSDEDGWGLKQAKIFYSTCAQQKEDIKLQGETIIEANIIKSCEVHVSELISRVSRKFNTGYGNEAMRMPAIMGLLRHNFGINLGFKTTLLKQRVGSNYNHAIKIEDMLSSSNNTLPWEMKSYYVENDDDYDTLSAYTWDEMFDRLPSNSTKENDGFNEHRRAQWRVFLSNLLGNDETKMIFYMDPNKLNAIWDSCSYFDKSISRIEIVTIVKDLIIRSQNYLESNVVTINIWSPCLKGTMNVFPYILTHQYLKHFGPEIKVEVEEIFQNIQKAFKELVDASPLWNQSVKSFAKEKVDAIPISIVSPSWMRNKTVVEAKYKHISLESHWSYEKTILEIIVADVGIKFEEPFKEYFSELNETWPENTMTYNAFYQPTHNIIEIPAGYLHYPNFGFSRKYLTYGAIGTVVGHELTHGLLYTIGRLLHNNGSKFNSWDDASNATYERQKNCFINSTSNYILPSFSKNDGGRLTLEETIADSGGVELAFHAYENLVLKNGKELPLPGLEIYTSQQLFCIVRAQTMCVPTSPEKLKLVQWPHFHPPNEIRTLEIMKQSSAFRSAWNCSTVANEERCKIW